MKITRFDRQNLRQFNADLEAAVRKVAEQYGVEVSVKSGSFDSETFNKGFKFVTVNPGVPKKEYLQGTAFDRTLIGKSFEYNGNAYEIVDLMPSSPEFPVIGKSIRGARYKFPAAVLSKIIK